MSLVDLFPRICAITFAFLIPLNAATASDEVIVTTLNWPPYTGTDLPKMGATSEVVRQAFSAAGVDTKFEILPWKRAISTAKNDKSKVAYFPGYHCQHLEGFVASDPIGNGPLGFAEHVEGPISWSSVDDLGEQKLKIGTVLGYSNTAEFDEKAGTGWVRAIPANDDLTNLKKLLRRRIDAAVIDKLVLSYLLATEDALKSETDALQFNALPLEDKTLFLCFVDSDDGRSWRDRFNEGLKKIDAAKIVDDYFQNEL